MKRLASSLVALALLVGAAAPRANAEPLTYTFHSPDVNGSFVYDTADLIPVYANAYEMISTFIQNPSFTSTIGPFTFTEAEPSLSAFVDPVTFNFVHAGDFSLVFTRLDPVANLTIDTNGMNNQSWSLGVGNDQFSGTGDWTVSAGAAVPEPASLTLLGVGAACLTGFCWRRPRNRAA